MAQPESKAAAIFCLILAVALDPALPLWRSAIYLVYLFSLAALFRVQFIEVVKRSLVIVPFLLIIIFFGVWSGSDPERSFLLVQKAVVSAIALAVLGLGTDFPGLVKGLHRVGLPATLVMMLSFMYRYLELLLHEAKRMEIARNQRYFGGQYLRQFRILGNMIGSLFLRTYERGERVYAAMLLRGYSLEIKPEAVSYRSVDKLMVGAGVGILLMLGAGMLWHY